MVVRYEHASEERDALLAKALNQLAESSNVVPIVDVSPTIARVRATRARWKVRCWSYRR